MQVQRNQGDRVDETGKQAEAIAEDKAPKGSEGCGDGPPKPRVIKGLSTVEHWTNWGESVLSPKGRATGVSLGIVRKRLLQVTAMAERLDRADGVSIEDLAYQIDLLQESITEYRVAYLGHFA
jgi:hypothetical protein